MDKCGWKKVKGTEQHEHAGTNEKEIVEEITKDIINHFNDDEDLCTNQQTIGFKDGFRDLS